MSGPNRNTPTLGIDYDREAWRAGAACAGTFELMYDRTQEKAAKSLCSLCPVIADCEAYAVEYRPPAGILAGVESKEREKARRRLQRAASRK